MASTTLTPPSLAPKTPPVYRSAPFFGVVPEFRRNPVGMFVKAGRQHGDVVVMYFGPSRTYVLYHPDYAKQVLQDNNRNYFKQPFTMSILKIFAGDNVFTGDGDFWLQQRRTMQPAFHRQRIAGFGRSMTDCAEQMLDRWKAAAGKNETLWIEKEMMRVTMQVVGLALFSVDVSEETSTLGQAFNIGDDYIAYRFRNVIYEPLFLPTPRNLQVRQAITNVRSFILEMIAERRNTSETKDDLLSMLMEARDEETGLGMDDEQVRREIGVMVGAGHETTADTLTWAFYLLSQNPDAERSLHDELAAVLGGRTPTIEDLPKLPYTRMVIDETLRMYPPAYLLGRQTVAADEFGGYRVPPKSDVLMAVYAMHRDPRWWEAPDSFDPGRFLPERSESRPKFAYLPFGGGPRQCIGNLFALTEAQLILATLAQHYKLRLKPGHPVIPEPKLTLVPKHGLPMTLIPR